MTGTDDGLIGSVLTAGPRRMTRERMRWYCDALETAAAADGRFRVADPTIHSDDDFARANGLPGIIADGMLSANWISSLLYTHFGTAYLAAGELTTKFIRPVYEDETIQALARVTGREHRETGDVYTLDVWCQTADGTPCTVGTATVPAGAAVPAAPAERYRGRDA